MRVQSDLARECGCERSADGIRVTSGEAEGYEILRVQIKSEEAAERIGKPCGRYVTVSCGMAGCDEEYERARRVLAVEIREMAQRMTGKRIDGGFSLLVVGVGNAAMTPDALGPQTVGRLSVTRHQDGAHAFGGRSCLMAAFAPGVVGQTGLETAELVRGAAMVAAPDLVLVIDALAARETSHLGATVQLSDTGLQPGGGTGRARPALTRETVGVPVMALGVPTVVESATLIGDALAHFGLDPQAPEFEDLVGNGVGFFVTPKEIDALVPCIATLLAGAIEKAFFVI